MESSDHAYFSIKDEQSVINCVIFSRSRSQLKIEPKIGMKVKVYGGVDFYAQGGKLQIIATDIEDLGSGDLHELFNKLFKKLKDEGLFDSSHKKPIPVLPRRIGVVTSGSGKVISDIVNTIRKRNPHYDIPRASRVLSVLLRSSAESVISTAKRMSTSSLSQEAADLMKSFSASTMKV